MNICHIDHINIAAPAALLVQVRQFYVDILGLQDGFRPAFSGPGHWLYAGSRPLVHLSESDRHLSGNGHLDHVAFQARGLDQLITRLAEAGIEYRLAHIPEIALSQVFFNDPTGNGLEVNFQGETPVEQEVLAQ